ncbi:MAG: SDR family NAD(P)-dependent oxidoreductase [Chloroflexota bacterium]
MSEGRLANQVAIVTGASKGIGKATALALAREGARVVMVARGEETLAAAEAEIRSVGGEVAAMPTDVTDSGQVERMNEETLRRFGKLDIMINNAGVEGSGKMVSDTDDASWHRVIAGNLHSCFYCCRAALKPMLQAKYGRIVNISSRVGLAGQVLGSSAGTWSQGDYGVAKAGVVTLTKHIAFEVAPHGVTVNAIAPGPIMTPMLSRVGADEIKRRAGLIPVGRLGQPEDIANAALFLVLPENSFITGEIMNVNGGTWMS